MKKFNCFFAAGFGPNITGTTRVYNQYYIEELNLAVCDLIHINNMQLDEVINVGFPTRVIVITRIA